MTLRKALDYRKKLVLREQATSVEVLRAFQTSYKTIQAASDNLLEQITNARKNGEPVSPAFLFERSRLQNLLDELTSEMENLAQGLGRITTGSQKSGVAAALDEAHKILSSGSGSIDTILEHKTSGLDAGAINKLVGLSSRGEPISKLFSTLTPELVQNVKDALINGVAIGSGVEAIARDIKNALGTTASHALTIARTESTGAYREATRLVYEKNKKLVQNYVWVASLDLRTCPTCWRFHGEIFPTSEKFYTHPNCRCTLIGVFENSEKIKPGREVFRALSEGEQRAVLGSARFDLYKSGKHDLDDFIGERKSDFGKTRYIKPLDEIGKTPKAKPVRPATKPTQAKPAQVAKPKPSAKPVAQASAVEPFQWTTHTEAEAYFEKKFPHIVFDFKGTSPGVMNPSLKAFDELAAQFPKVVERLEYLGTFKAKQIPFTRGGTTKLIDPGTPLARAYGFKFGRNTVAHATVDGKQLALNPAYFGNEEKMREAQNRGSQSGHYNKSRFGRLDGTIIHEFGHHVENYFQTFADRKISPFYTLAEYGKTSFAKLYAEHRKTFRATLDVSRYSLTNNAESFAETFHAYKVAPRATWSKEVFAMEKLVENFPELEKMLIESGKVKSEAAAIADGASASDVKARVKADIEKARKLIGLD